MIIESKYKKTIIKISIFVAKTFSALLLLYSLSVVYNFIVLNSSVDFKNLGIWDKISYVLVPVFSVIIYLLLSIIFLAYTYISEAVLAGNAKQKI